MTASYPSATPTTAALRGNLVDNLATALSANLLAADTTLNVDDTTDWPSAGLLSIRGASGSGSIELCSYSGKTATSFTGVTRNVNSRYNSAWVEDDIVELLWAADHHNRHVEETIAIATDLRNAISADLDDAATPAATAASIKIRLDQIVSVMATMLGGDWKTSAAFLKLAGGTMAGNIAMGTNKITGLAAATTNGDALRYEQVVGLYLLLAGGTMTGDINMGGNDITGLASLNGSFLGSFKNRYCNGAFKFDQRNEGSAYTVNNSSIRTLDMVGGEAPSSQGVFTVQRQSSVVPTGFAHAIKVETTTADASGLTSEDYEVRMACEGHDVADFLLGTASAKQITISFWVRSSLTGTFGLSVKNSAFNRSYVAQYTINSADTWEYKTITLTGDTTGTWLVDTGVGLRLGFDIGSGSDLEDSANTWVASHKTRVSGNVRVISTLNATWYLAGLQVELGGQASEFERVPHGIALARIQRYVEKSYAQGTAIATATNVNRANAVAADIGSVSQYAPRPFKVEKRAAPTVTVYNAGSGASGSAGWVNTSGTGTDRTTTAADTYTHQFAFSQTVDATEFLCLGHFLATAEII